MRAAFTLLALAVATLTYGPLVLLAQLLGVRERRGSVYERAPRWWARALIWAGGVTVRVHGREKLADGQPHVFLANHVSWFDIPAIIVALPEFGFIAKRELSEIFVFGKAARAVGVIFIDRENRRNAFAAYDEAAGKIRGGRSVIVFPEGTRGETYAIRPLKKGPFVLAVSAGVPIVPVLIHGTIAVSPKGRWRVEAGEVDVHILDPIPTAGCSYDDRDALAERVRVALADALRREHGVEPALVDVPAPRVREGGTPSVAVSDSHHAAPVDGAA